MSVRTKKIAFGGLLLALFCIVMYIDSIFPLLDRSFLLLGSFFVMTAIIELGFAGGIIFYVSALVLGMIILPVKSGIVLFGIFFGLYALEKYFAELIPYRFIRIIIKLVFANISLAIAYFLFRSFLFDAFPDRVAGIDISIPLIVIFLVVYQIIFLLYDWFLSLFAIYYYKNISTKLKINM